MSTDSIPAALPEPGMAQQSSEDRLAVCAVGLPKSYGSTGLALACRLAPGAVLQRPGSSPASPAPLPARFECSYNT